MIQSMSRSAKTWAAAALIGIATFCGQALAVNDIGWQWTFENATPSGSGTTNGPWSAEVGFAGTATGVHASAASTWSSPAGNGSAKSFSVNTWTAGDYWQFDITDTVGLQDIGFQVDQVSSTTGPGNWIFQYSTNNGASFTNFTNYTVQPNVVQATWSSAGTVKPVGLDTYNFDLRSVTALNNSATNIIFRLTAANPIVAAQMGSTPAAGGTDRIDNATIYYNYDPTQSPVPPTPAPPVLPQAGDIAWGMGSGRNLITLQLVRGSVAPNGGAKPSPYSTWTQTNFLRWMKFDNTGGAHAHNVNGNLLAVDAGASASAGGKIYSLGTQGSNPQPAGQLLFTTGTGNGATRLGGLSVSPDNTKIAVSGFDTGRVMVFNYTPGNSQGTGTPSLSNRQESNAILGTGSLYTAGSQQGTAWLNNNTVLAFSGSGSLYEVNATTLADTLKATVATANIGQNSTALAYNPNVSPYIYAMYSGFTTVPSATTVNTLYVFDTSYNELTGGGISFSTSAASIRDIALDSNGNLFFSTQGGAQTIEYIPNVTSVGSITANSSIDWYVDENVSPGSNFSGLDIGFAAPGLLGDFNSDGKVDAGDYVTWRKNNGTNNALANDNGLGTPIGPAHYNLWRSNFGNPPGAGSGLEGAEVPEPASAVLLVIGLVSFCLRRRSA